MAHRLWVVCGLLALTACSASETPKNSTTFQATPSIKTALLGVSLFPDGTLTLDVVREKPVSWRGPELPFDPGTHRPRTAARDGTRTPLPSLPSLPTTPHTGHLRGPSPPMASEELVESTTRYAVIVTHESLTVPRVIPVQWAPAGSVAGDVADVWNDGATLIKAPSYGTSTRFAIVRIDSRGTTALAEGAL